MLTVITKYSYVDDQLDDLKADLGIDQWAADSDELDGTKMTSGYREVLAQTLRKQAEDVDDAV
jgi:hypothetical protein